MTTCPYCEAEVSDSAKKCRFCGEWLAGSQVPSPSLSPAAPPPLNPVNVTVQREESVLFAVITLICYFFIYPAALILNIVGLLTGPQRGCFWGMFFLFVALPIIVVVALIFAGIPVLAIAMEFLDQLL